MRLAFLALVCLGATPAWAQAPANQTPAAPAEPQYPKISIGTLSYFQYAAELKNRDGFNAFDVTRGYINIAGDIAKNVKFRITPDVRRITDGSLAGSLTFRLKFGFVEFDELTPRSWVRFGLHQTPWLDSRKASTAIACRDRCSRSVRALFPDPAISASGYSRARQTLRRNQRGRLQRRGLHQGRNGQTKEHSGTRDHPADAAGQARVRVADLRVLRPRLDR
jgi:hypothetical protein